MKNKKIEATLQQLKKLGYNVEDEYIDPIILGFTGWKILNLDRLEYNIKNKLNKGSFFDTTKNMSLKDMIIKADNKEVADLFKNLIGQKW